MTEGFLCELNFGNQSETIYVNHSAIVVGLLSVEGTGIGLGAVFLLITLLHLVIFERLKTTYTIIQFQICLTLFLSDLFIGIGFLTSPCQPWEINQAAFAYLCVTLTELQLASVLSAFAWKLIEALHICHLAAQACHQKFHSPEELKLPTLQRMSSYAQRSQLQLTFSNDLPIQPRSEQKRPRKKSINEEVVNENRTWYISFFARFRPPIWVLLCYGYLPAIVIACISFGVKPPVHFQTGFEEGTTILDVWTNVTGIDTFCWPGIKSSLIWYMVAAVPLMICISLFFRLKAIQMVRILRGGNSTRVKATAMSSVTDWQRQSSSREKPINMDEFHLKSSSLILLVMFFSWTLGILQSIFVWGLTIPFGTMCFLLGFVYLLMYVASEHNRFCICCPFFT